MKPFNLIYIHTHDTGREIQPYNPAVSTPNLMNLSREGIVFRNAYCVGPTCSPSRSGLLTGQYPHENGMYGLAHRGFSLNDYRKHLANFLKENGYETFLFGMQHEAADEHTIGYDYTFVESRKSGVDREFWDIRNAKEAISCLKNRKNTSNPFFISYGMECTHKPYPKIDKDINPDYVKVPACLPDYKETRKDFAGFMTSARIADQIIGEIINTIKEEKLYDNTIILYTTDHGVALPNMKCTLFDTGIGVACVLSVPGYREGKVTDALVSQLDIYPTLCELLDLKKPDWLRGVSLVPLLNGTSDKVRDYIASEINYHAARDPQRCIRTDRYKYIRRYSKTSHGYVPCNIDSGEAKEFLVNNGLLNLTFAEEQLYDLYFDPNERNNLATNISYTDELKTMRILYQEYLNTTNDFIESQGLPIVEGMILNKESCYDADSINKECYETI